MRILIVEDSAFNAFCLKRLLEQMDKELKVDIVPHSEAARSFLAKNPMSLVVLDGDLGASDGIFCNGPALADTIWANNPQQAIVAWSDSTTMRAAFAEVFKEYNKPFNANTCWSKVVSLDRLSQSLSYLMKEHRTLRSDLHSYEVPYPRASSD